MPPDAAFWLAGAFTLILGAAHFFFPVLLDFRAAIPDDGPPLRPFRLGPIRYATRRSDVRGIAWVMNHAASYVLVSIGAFDLCVAQWKGTPAGRWLCAWIAAWWAIRAASQRYLGRRRGDLVVGLLLGSLAAMHAWAALAGA